MIASKLKELAAAKAKVIALERQIEAERDKHAKELASLPARFGFASVGEFAAAVLKAAPGKKRKPKARRARPSSVSKPVTKLLPRPAEAPAEKRPTIVKTVGRDVHAA